jgi:hypothetical protein
MPGGRLALHLAVHGDGLSEQRDQADGSSFTSFTVIGARTDPAGVGQVSVPPRATWGEAFVTAPTPTGKELPMVVTGPSLQRPGRFTIDIGSLDCR